VKNQVNGIESLNQLRTIVYSFLLLLLSLVPLKAEVITICSQSASTYNIMGSGGDDVRAKLSNPLYFGSSNYRAVINFLAVPYDRSSVFGNINLGVKKS